MGLPKVGLPIELPDLQIGHRDVRPAERELDANLLADPTRATGDERHFPPVPKYGSLIVCTCSLTPASIWRQSALASSIRPQSGLDLPRRPLFFFVLNWSGLASSRLVWSGLVGSSLV